MTNRISLNSGASMKVKGEVVTSASISTFSSVMPLPIIYIRPEVTLMLSLNDLKFP